LRETILVLAAPPLPHGGPHVRIFVPPYQWYIQLIVIDPFYKDMYRKASQFKDSMTEAENKIAWKKHKCKGVIILYGPLNNFLVFALNC
jgi:hypothetical protein